MSHASDGLKTEELVTKRRPTSAPVHRKKAESFDIVAKHFSAQLRKKGGFPLRNWLSKKGIVVDAAITKAQERELKIVFGLYDEDGSGKCP